jgi:uncharacterized RDD family membrane protein YckC
VTQPQDPPTAPGKPPGAAAGQPGPSFGGSDQAQPGYGAPGQPAPFFGEPGNQGYPSYPQAGYGPGYPPAGYGSGNPQAGYGSGYPQAGYGQPYHPAYGQPYRGYGAAPAGKDPALAEWWRRLLARIIDGFILGVIFAPLWIPPWRTFIRTMQGINNQYPPGTSLGAVPAARNAIATAEVHLAGSLVVSLLAFYLVAFLYDWIQHWQWGQTIGKRALGIRVVRADGNPSVGAGAACGRAAIYAFAPLIPLVGSLFELLNELWLTWDPRRQCLHDKAAHTVVVKKDYYQGSQPRPRGW